MGSLVGTKVGSYLIEEKIGQGTTSLVYRACFGEEKLAIKVIFRPTRFVENEKKAASELGHPNVLHCINIIEENGYIYFVMPWCQHSLNEILDERDRPFSEFDAREIMIQIIKGLQHAHNRNFAHRDIKPENILMLNGRFVIADWGLCTPYSESSYILENVGSYLFSSPEIVNGKPYRGPEVDVWSLGCLLYELVTQTSPFYMEGDSKHTVKLNISNSRYANDAHLNLSVELNNLLKMMLEVNPVKRITLENIFCHPWFSRRK